MSWMDGQARWMSKSNLIGVNDWSFPCRTTAYFVKVGLLFHLKVMLSCTKDTVEYHGQKDWHAELDHDIEGTVGQCNA